MAEEQKPIHEVEKEANQKAQEDANRRAEEQRERQKLAEQHAWQNRY